MKETYEIALDLLQRRVGPELEWAVDEIKKELATRPNVVWCEECYEVDDTRKNEFGGLWCKIMDGWMDKHDYCSNGLSRLQAIQEEAELFDHDPKDELADDEYHRLKERGEI